MSQMFTASLLALSLLIPVFGTSAQAMDLDWHGQFRTETNWIYGYSHGLLKTDNTKDYGYQIPLNGDSPASFQNLFLRMTPRLMVNDNISVYSNVWFGSPDKGIFGGDLSDSSAASRSVVSQTRTGNSTISASTFYAEVATDFGTFSVGRLPLNWGLGVVWNTIENGFDRMPSTADGFRLESKLGAFKFIPAMYKYRAGSNFGGATSSTGTTTSGFSSASDYSLALTYDNDDEQMSMGLLFVRRLAGMQAHILSPFSVVTNPSTDTVSTTGYSYNVWDIYFKKKTGIFTASAEIPLVTGLVGNNSYSSVAAAVKVDAQLDDQWKLKLNGGLANGQDNVSSTANAASAKYTAFYFHPDYRPGLLMFNYNLRNLSDGSLSPFNNPVVNAEFLALGFDYVNAKWSHGANFLYAIAVNAANGAAGGAYFNTLDGYYKSNVNGATAQQKDLGFEMDYSLGYQWDDALKIGLTAGLYFPGKFYEFSNSATPNVNKTVFGTGFNMNVLF
jgi:hypothetical protein